MPVVHFAHSNGFPALTYRYFLEQLRPLEVQYLPKFGHDPRFNPRFHWGPLADQLIHSIEQQKQPVVGLGHSLGAVVSLYAYYKRPDLFSGLIMMDPPFFAFSTRLALLGARFLGVSGHLVPPAKKAKKRNTRWRSREEASHALRNKALFKNFHPEAFDDYIQHGIVATGRGDYTLDFSATEEYRIFKHTPFALGSGQIDVPSFYLYSNRFEIGSPQSITSLQQKFGKTEFIPIDAGHMFPMEKPVEISNLIKGLI